MAKFIQDRVARVPSQNVRSTGGFLQLTLAGNHGISTDSAQFQVLDPDGAARDVYLADVSRSAGAWFRFTNIGGAGGTLEIKTGPGAPALISLANNESIFMVCNGFNWSPA